MNIAIFTDTYFPDINGIASSIYTLSNRLISKGHHVYIFSISAPTRKTKLVHSNPPVYRIPSVSIFFVKPYRAALPMYLDVLEICKKFKIDIVHSQTEFSMGLMAMTIATSLGIPLIHTYHTMLEDYTYYIGNGKMVTPNAARRYSAIFVNRVQALIVPTEKVKNSLTNWGAKGTPTYIIPSGINLRPFMKENNNEDFTRQIKKEFGIKDSDKVLLSIGRIAKEKSLDMAIRQMPEILKINPDILFVIVGRGPATEDLKALTIELNIQDRVIFPGSVSFDDVGKYYQIGDAFISCSTTETQGLTYYEALAAGLPVIARYDDCIADVLEDTVNSRVFKDAKDLPLCVKEIFENDETRARMSAKAVESVKGFDDEVFALRVEKAYYNTLNAFMTKRAQMDSHVPMHVVFKTQSFINRTLTLSVNGTKKIFKPVIRKSRNLNRRLSKKRMERINRLTDLHDGGV